MSIDDVRSALYSAFGERQVSTIYTPVDSYQVIMEVAPGRQAGRERVQQDLRALVDRRAGAAVELRDGRAHVGPTSINHVGQLQAVTVSFNLAPGAALGDATAKLERYRDADPHAVVDHHDATAATRRCSRTRRAARRS